MGLDLDRGVRSTVWMDGWKQLQEFRDPPKTVPSYEDINERLNNIQQQVLRTDKGPVPAGVKGRIDVMIDATRQMMQKYLQINLVREYEAKLAPK